MGRGGGDNRPVRSVMTNKQQRSRRIDGAAVAGWALFTGYVGYNFLRKTWPTAIAQPAFAKRLGLNMDSIGSISSMHGVMYGASKFGSSVLCDYFAERTPHVFALGLLLSGVAAAIMAACDSFGTLIAMWALQGLLQGLAWPAASRILLDRVGADELGWYWGLVSISGNVGQGVAPVVLTWLCTLTGSSRTIFVLSGVASSTLALAVGCALRLPPPSQPLLLSSENGRSPVAAAKGKGGAVGAEDQQAVAAGASNDVDAQEADACVSVGGEAQALLPRGAWTEVLTSAPIWLMSITNLLIYLPMKACGEWGALIAVQHYGASVLTGASLVACHELGGFLGGCSAPGLSDLLGAARCAHAAAAFCVLGAVAFLSLRQLEPAGAMASDPALPPARRIAIFGLFALAGVGLHGVKALAGLHVARIAPRRASGMAGGLLELLGQVGAACAGWPLGLLATSSVGGWDAAIGVFTVCAVLSTITATAAAMLAAAAAQDKVKTL